jgi:hypothetical protein
MKAKYRRRTKLYLLDRLKLDITESYNLTDIEQTYLFSHRGGGTVYKLQRILETRLITYQQQQNYKDRK